MLFPIGSDIKSNTKMQSTNAVRAFGSQQDITNLQISTKRVPFSRILWLLVKGQLEVMRGVILAVIINRLFLGGCGLPARNCGAFFNPLSGRQVVVFILLEAERVFSQFPFIDRYQCCDEVGVFHFQCFDRRCEDYGGS